MEQRINAFAFASGYYRLQVSGNSDDDSDASPRATSVEALSPTDVKYAPRISNFPVDWAEPLLKRHLPEARRVYAQLAQRTATQPGYNVVLSELVGRHIGRYARNIERTLRRRGTLFDQYAQAYELETRLVKRVLLPLAVHLKSEWRGHTVVYGRDCDLLAMGLSQLNVSNVRYCIMPRPFIERPSLMAQLRPYIDSCGVRSGSLHIDTGFNGSVPEAVIRTVGGHGYVCLLSSSRRAYHWRGESDDTWNQAGTWRSFILEMEHAPKHILRCTALNDAGLPDEMLSGCQVGYAARLAALKAEVRKYKRTPSVDMVGLRLNVGRYPQRPRKGKYDVDSPDTDGCSCPECVEEHYGYF